MATKYYDRPIFGTNNAKIKKGESEGFYSVILNFAPHDIAFKPSKYGFDLPDINLWDIIGLGHNPIIEKYATVCPFATLECKSVCLFTAGKGSYPSVKIGRIKKTQAFLLNPNAFVQQMWGELLWHKTKAEKLGMVLCIRLNGTQDIPFEDYKIEHESKSYDLVGAITKFIPESKLYDYTKWVKRSSEYNLTYSFTGSKPSLKNSLKLLESGKNIAFVYEGKMPKLWHGYPVYSGDINDLRFQDPKGHAIALKAKGTARGKVSKNGFVQIYA